ncbi:MAG TPA: hypothetical protein VN776_15765 [Terracidiphilus sp.]|nr:hypothetical protein [Terracidiphilus sp.]
MSLPGTLPLFCGAASSRRISAAGFPSYSVNKIIVLLVCCLPLGAQTRRHAAGTDAEGNPLTVIERHFPERDADEKRCVPKVQYGLDQSRGGRAAAPEPVVTLCQTDIPIETSVKIGQNWIQVNLGGSAQNGFYLHRTYQLSPWRATKMDACQFLGSENSTYEEWDFRLMKGQAWTASVETRHAICDSGPEVNSYLLVPMIAYDARRLEASHASLGSCAMKLDASGKNGFITWGKPDPQDPVEVKLLWIGPRTLVAQVADSQRSTRPASSWVNADHFEIWMGERNGGLLWQFGIPVDAGAVRVGYGEPAKLPVVHRWAAGQATVLLIELPPWPSPYGNGVTLVYSQSLEGRAQKRLIATSHVKRSDNTTLGVRDSEVDKNSAAEYVTCGTVNGALDITGGPKKPLLAPPPEPGGDQ